ncbi:MAG: hypothetical protein Q8R24_09790 [Legionellaceae bacterium]|nr:hypothetical protein [Legionellaceae bacterium]
MLNKKILARLNQTPTSEVEGESRLNEFLREQVDTNTYVKPSLSLNDMNEINNRWATHPRALSLKEGSEITSMDALATDDSTHSKQVVRSRRERELNFFPPISSSHSAACSDGMLDKMSNCYSPLTGEPFDITNNKLTRRTNTSSVGLGPLTPLFGKSSLYWGRIPTSSVLNSPSPSWGLVDIDDSDNANDSNVKPSSKL